MIITGTELAVMWTQKIPPMELTSNRGPSMNGKASSHLFKRPSWESSTIIQPSVTGISGRKKAIQNMNSMKFRPGIGTRMSNQAIKKPIIAAKGARAANRMLYPSAERACALSNRTAFHAPGSSKLPSTTTRMGPSVTAATAPRMIAPQTNRRVRSLWPGRRRVRPWEMFRLAIP